MRFLLLIAGFWLSLPLPAQPSSLASARRSVYEAYLAGDGPAWEQAIARLRALSADPASCDPAALLEWATAEYGYIGYRITLRQASGLESRISDAEQRLQALLRRRPADAAAHALLGGFIAQRIQLNSAKGLYLGPRSSSYLEQAIQKGPQDAVAWTEMGNLRYHAPGFFGGSYAEALTCFRQAVEYFERNPALRADNWQYLHALAWLGKSYEQLGQQDQAIGAYRKALAAEPRFAWVRDELLPAALKR
jgi:tetratricopeptide (TPR) repeat protein